MRSILALILATAPALALAADDDQGADWRDAGDVAALLSERSVDYPDAAQDFFGDGTTAYFADRPASGRWEARDGRYCTQWPPEEEWNCFDLAVSGDGARVRFTDDAGNEVVGVFRE
jgi:hypothetical protein